MIKSEEKYNRKRYKIAYHTTTFSITLVLFMLGLLVLILLHTQRLTDYVRENIGIMIMLRDNIDEYEIMELKSRIETNTFVKRTQYTSKDDAAKELSAELGEDFVGFIGYNPLLPVIEVFLTWDYCNEDGYKLFERTLHTETIIEEVHYQKPMVELINANISKISTGVLIFSGLLLIISVMLIYSTIRLAVYSKRLLIKSMLLVGATQRFIRRPFIKSGFVQGIMSGFFALGILFIVIVLAQQKLPGLNLLSDFRTHFLLALSVILFGVCITWLSNYFAVKKYLNINSEELY